MLKKMMKLMKAKVTLMLILVENNMVLLSLKMTLHGSIICMFSMVGFKKNFVAPFYGWGGTHFIDLGRMKG